MSLELEKGEAKSPLIYLGKLFCFVGAFDGFERSDLRGYVESKGAKSSHDVSERTDVLIIGSRSTRCCTFSCCDRVIEKAKELSEKGSKLQIIGEEAFLSGLSQEDLAELSSRL
jgi:NAD-dependent DNA ligase